MIVSARPGGVDKHAVVTSGLDMPEDIVIDEVSRNIYFTDSGLKHVAVCRLDGSFCTVLAKKGVQMPRAIRLHHVERLVVYSDWGKTPAVVVMGMDGSERRDLVNTNL